MPRDPVPSRRVRYAAGSRAKQRVDVVDRVDVRDGDACPGRAEGVEARVHESKDEAGFRVATFAGGYVRGSSEPSGSSPAPAQR